MMTDGPDNRRLMAQINVTPLVDVMLVLLIIFMVTAPMMTEGMDVNLPKVAASAVSTEEEPLVITIDKTRRIYINGRPVKDTDLKNRLAAVHDADGARAVLLRADESVPYGQIMAAMAEVKKAGIEKIGLITEPLEKVR